MTSHVSNICRNEPPVNCHCLAAKLDYETDAALEEGFLRLRRSDATTPLRKHLPKRLFHLLRYRTTRLGATLLDAVRVGLLHHDAPVGAVLPDALAYDAFHALFQPLLAERHSGFDAYCDSQPGVAWGDWRRVRALDPRRRFVERVAVSASRNLPATRFTPTMTLPEFMKVEDLIILTLYKLPGEYKGNYLYIQCIDPARKKELELHNCLFDCGDKYDHTAKIPRFWSYGRGVFVNSDYSFVVWVNAKDHLRVISQENSGDLQSAYRRLANVMPYIDCRLRSARHEHIGYLTVSLDDLGSGLTIEADVHLRDFPTEGCRIVFENIAKVYHLEIKYIQDDLYRVFSRSRLGYTEFELVRDFSHGLRELLFMAHFFEKSPLKVDVENENDGKLDEKPNEGDGDNTGEGTGPNPDQPLPAYIEDSAHGNATFGSDALPMTGAGGGRAPDTESVSASSYYSGTVPARILFSHSLTAFSMATNN